jgi:hypothetical protein
MADEIINRIANSALITIDLEDYYPGGERRIIDIKDWLYEGLVLREKEFRTYIKSHDWAQYHDQFIGLTCSTDAIIPAWAYMLITTQLDPFAKRVILGDSEALESAIYQDIINNLDITEFENKPIIIKGCSKKPVPKNAYLFLTSRLLPIAKSIMYGEACSSVPLYKKK